MALRPEDRYDSARALADDVERLAGRRAGRGLAGAEDGPCPAVGEAAPHAGGRVSGGADGRRGRAGGRGGRPGAGQRPVEECQGDDGPCPGRDPEGKVRGPGDAEVLPGQGAGRGEAQGTGRRPGDRRVHPRGGGRGRAGDREIVRRPARGGGLDPPHAGRDLPVPRRSGPGDPPARAGPGPAAVVPRPRPPGHTKIHERSRRDVPGRRPARRRPATLRGVTGASPISVRARPSRLPGRAERPRPGVPGGRAADRGRAHAPGGPERATGPIGSRRCRTPCNR